MTVHTLRSITVHYHYLLMNIIPVFTIVVK